MTILSSAYISLTGLLTFSKALDVISDNVANLNTPGFKAGDLFFNSLESAEEFSGLGSGRDGLPGAGATVTGAGRRFTQGEHRETGTATHLAIDGAGFFVLRDEAGLVLTRAGQFQLDAEGRLTDPTGRRVVQALGSGGQLSDVVIDRTRTNPPRATTTVGFSGNLSVGSTTHSATRTVFDAAGRERVLTFAFTNNTAVTPGSWRVRVTDAAGVELLAAGEIRFQGSGAPAAGFNTLQITLASDAGTSSAITLNFGTPGSFDGATSFSAGATSTLQASSSDGFGPGRLASFAFNERGVLTLTYSNGQTETGPRVALATVPDPQQLKSETGTVFVAAANQRLEFSSPGEGAAGRLAPRNVELANVELSREFADIIILQRGFQASSQVLNISSQLIEDVYNNLSGRR